MLVILDEPTNDVDPVRRRLLWARVRSLADEGAAVLLVTHNVIEAERSVDRLAILDHGRVLTEGTPADLKAGIADDLRLELVLDPGSDAVETPQFTGPHTVMGNRIFGHGAGTDGRPGRDLGGGPEANGAHRGVLAGSGDA